MSTWRLVELTDTVVSLEAQLSNGRTGATALVALREAGTANSWLDFADNTFKTVGWTTRQAVMAEVSVGNAPGLYRTVIDITALLPARVAGNRMVAEFNVSAVGPPFQVHGIDQIALVVSIYALAAATADAVWDELQAGHVIGGSFGLFLDALVSSRATQAQILSDATPFAGANVDATISSRESEASASARAVTNQGEHDQTQIDIAALNDLSQADVQAALTAQGYTAVRAPNLDNLDATVSSRESEASASARAATNQTEHDQTQVDIAALNDLSQADVQTALTAQGYTVVRAANLDNLDAAVTTRSSHDAADVDTQLSGTHGAGSWLTGSGASPGAVADAVWDEGRAGHVAVGSFGEALDARVSLVETEVAAAARAVTNQGEHDQTQIDIAALNDLSQADVQAALTAQGYTVVRAANLDALDVSVSSRESEAFASGRSALNVAEHDATQALILALNNVSAGDVWEELSASHLTAGTMGLFLAILRHQGAVHVDTIGGSAGTVIGTNGTPENPVSTLADAVTLAAALGVRRYVLRGTITLVSAHDGWVFEGRAGEAAVNLGGQDVSESLFLACEVSGVVGTGPIRTEDCLLDGVTYSGVSLRCRLKNTTVLQPGTTTLIGCTSEVPGLTTPVLDMVGVGRSVNMRAYSGGIDVRNMIDVSQVVTVELVAGQVILGATNTAGTITLRGIGNLTDASAGTTVEKNALLNETKIADGVLGRDISLVEAALDGDRNLLRVIQKLANRVVNAAGLISIFRSDDSTVAWTQGTTLDAAALPITAVDTN